MISYILAIITGLAVLGIDQYTKIFMLEYLANKSNETKIIPGFIDLILVHNGGGAWGMLSGHTWILLSVTIVIMLISVTLLLKMGLQNKLMFWAIILVLSGGIGNMIDRIFRDGKVVDFLHFTFWSQFPVFNVADIAIVLGAGLLVLYFIISSVKESRKKKSTITQSAEVTDGKN